MSSIDLSSTLLRFLRLFHGRLAAHSFSYPASYPSSVSQVSSGLFLYQLLHTLEPAHFDMDGIDSSSSASADTRADNLQQLLVSIETYLVDVRAGGEGAAEGEAGGEAGASGVELGDVVDSERMSDGDILRLVQLVVLCAVNSGEREEVVGRVLEMSEKEQETMMFCINDISSRLGLTPAAAQTQTQRLSGSAATAPPLTPSSAASSLSLPSTSAPSTPTKPSPGSTPSFSSSQQLQSLEREAAQLRRVNAQQLSDLALLRSEQEQQSRRGDDTAAQLREKELTERLQREQQRHARELAETNHRIEEAAGSLHKQQRASLALEKERVSLLSSLEELKAREKEWQDRVQLAESRAEQAAALEAKVARLTARLDGLGDLQAQAEYSEEEARRSAERVLQLEREAREAASMREGLQRLKASLVKKEEEALDFRLRQEELEAEVADLREAVKERERQAKEAETEVRRLQEERRERDSREREMAAAATATSTAAGFELIGTPTSSLRAKLRKLETENEELRTKLTGGAAADRPAGTAASTLSIVEESELDIARSVAKLNESRYLEAMRQLQQMEREMRRLQRQQPSTPAQQSEEGARPTAELPKAQPLSTAGSAGAGDAASAAAGRKLRKYYELWKHTSKKVQLYRQKEDDWRRELSAAREQVRRLKDVIGDREREVEVREKVRVEEMAVSLRERRIMQAAFYELGMEYAGAVISGRLPAGKGRAGAGAGQPPFNVERTGGRVSHSTASPSQRCPLPARFLFIPTSLSAASVLSLGWRSSGRKSWNEHDGLKEAAK